MGKSRPRTARAREMAALIAACDRSGLPQRAFAQQHGITPGAFAWWRHTLRGRQVRPARGTTPAFVEVMPAPRAAPTVDGGAPFAVRLPSGVLVRIPPRFEATALETLLGVLVRTC